MKHLRLTVSVSLATALASFVVVSSASATTLEVGGVKQSGSVTIEATSSQATFNDTFGLYANSCASRLEMTTSTTTGPTVSGAINTLTFSPCRSESVVVHTKGTMSIERIGSTTNGTVRSHGALWTMPSPFGTLTCKTHSEGSDIGTITGVSSGFATIDIQVVLECGISVRWEGTYKTTTAIGVVA